MHFAVFFLCRKHGREEPPMSVLSGRFGGAGRFITLDKVGPGDYSY